MNNKGTMEQKNKLIPELRFPEFVKDGEWGEYALGKVLIKNSKKNRDSKYTTVQSVSNKFGFINQDEYFENRRVASKDTSNYYIIKKGYFAYNPSRIDVGSLAYKNDYETSIISPLYVSFKANNEFIDDIFLLYFFNSNTFAKQMIFEGGVRNTLNYENLIQIKVKLPQNLKEQKKIADCLSSLDELITAHNDKLETLKNHKKGLLQNLFPDPSTSSGQKVPHYRFPEFVNDGEWEEVELNKIAKKINNKNVNGKIKNVFTNSAVNGIVDQREYFDKDIADIGNLENYYLVQPGDYVYNPRISNSAPVGPISKNRTNIEGAMSPLYTIFRFINTNNDFYEYYFKTNHWYDSIRRVANAGVRFDRISITTNEFMSLKVLSTNSKEQQKIADCLLALDHLITAQTEKIEQLKAHKKGLMQGLFPQVKN